MADERSQVLFIQFARAPVAGQVKTRMMPHLSPEQACALHCELVLWTSRQLAGSGLGDIELSVAGDCAHPLFDRCRKAGVHCVSRQSGADLGQRMYRAIGGGLNRYKKVVLVGSDCPGIDRTYLQQAVCGLDRAPLVLGPAEDGGYVLIGASSIREDIFEHIPWGTASVYADTITVLRQRGLAWLELPTRVDVDRPDDLAAWTRLRARAV